MILFHCFNSLEMKDYANSRSSTIVQYRQIKLCKSVMLTNVINFKSQHSIRTYTVISVMVKLILSTLW